MHVKYEVAQTPMGAGEERQFLPGSQLGVPLFSRQYRYAVAITPSATPFTTAADGIMVSANANVTFTLADDPAATAVTLALLAGVQYDLAVAKVTTVSAGTAIALYHRKPAS